MVYDTVTLSCKSEILTICSKGYSVYNFLLLFLTTIIKHTSYVWLVGV